MNKSHGQTNTLFYKVWTSLKNRCNNKKGHAYYRYGERGISYCKKWERFTGFYEDMYDSYEPGLSLDRIDNDGDYCKENCRWATPKQQANNRRSNRMITLNGKTKSITEWIKTSELKKSTVAQRFHVYGWTLEDSLYKPVSK